MAFRNEFCEKAAIQYLGGATDIEVADSLEIHVSTLYRWQHDHPEFREAAELGSNAEAQEIKQWLKAPTNPSGKDAARVAAAKEKVKKKFGRAGPEVVRAGRDGSRKRRIFQGLPPQHRELESDRRRIFAVHKARAIGITRAESTFANVKSRS